MVGFTARCPRCVSRALLCPPNSAALPPCPPPNEPHLLWPSSCPAQRSAGFIECLTGNYQSDITCITWLSLLPTPAQPPASHVWKKTYSLPPTLIFGNTG